MRAARSPHERTPRRGNPGGKGRTGTDRRERGRRAGVPREEETRGPREGQRGVARFKEKELLTMDTSGPPTTKDAARCDNSREMRNAANRRDFQRGRRPRGLPRGHARPSVAQGTRTRARSRTARGREGACPGVPRHVSATDTETDHGATAPRRWERPESAPWGGAGWIYTKGANEPRPRIGRDHPANLSILITGGRETNRDVLSSGERSGRCPNQIPGPEGPGRCGGDATARGSSGSRSAWKGGDEEGDIPVRNLGAPAERAHRRVGPLESAARIG